MVEPHEFTRLAARPGRLLTRSNVNGFQLHLIKTPTTNGKVAVVVSESSENTKPLSVRGVVFP